VRTIFFVASAVAGTVAVYAVVEEPAIRLEQVQIIDIGSDVAALAVHPSRALLYASVRSVPGVAVMSIDRRTGLLERVAEVAVSTQLVSLACDPGGRWLFGASYRDHIVTSMLLDDNGIPAAQLTDVFAAGSHPHCVLPAPDGSIWVSVLGDDVVLRIPVASGRCGAA
jgi:6-phosphogluconolactonase